jgi:hypothetical protein
MVGGGEIRARLGGLHMLPQPGASTYKQTHYCIFSLCIFIRPGRIFKHQNTHPVSGYIRRFPRKTRGDRTRIYQSAAVHNVAEKPHHDSGTDPVQKQRRVCDGQRTLQALEPPRRHCGFARYVIHG